MPTITGTSTGGYQIVGNFLLLTIPQFELLFADPPNTEPRQLGYFYVLALGEIEPFPGRILVRGIVSTPGIYVLFPVPLETDEVRYSFYVRWKVASKTWTLNYV